MVIALVILLVSAIMWLVWQISRDRRLDRDRPNDDYYSQSWTPLSPGDSQPYHTHDAGSAHHHGSDHHGGMGWHGSFDAGAGDYGDAGAGGDGGADGGAGAGGGDGGDGGGGGGGGGD